MKILKITYYIISLAHVILQMFYFTKWNHRLGEIGKLASKLDPVTLINANLGLTQESFIFLSIALLTLAFYLSVSQHLSLLILEKKLNPEDEAKEGA